MKNRAVFFLSIMLFCAVIIFTGAETIFPQGWPSNTAENLPICTEIDYQEHPMITSDGAGGAIMAWFDNRSGDCFKIYAQRVDIYGKILWTSGGVLVCEKPVLTFCEESVLWTYALRMMPAGDGGAIFVWSDRRTMGDFDYNVYAQKVSSAGEPMWATDGIQICGQTGMQAVAGVVSDGDGGAIIVWDDRRAGDCDIYAQRIDTNGNVQWMPDGVPVHTGLGFQYFANPISDGSGGAIIAWLDVPIYMGDENSIRASRISASGAIEWTETICSPPGAAVGYWERFPATSDGAGGAIIAWWDFRGGYDSGWDIYAQRIDKDGHLKWIADGLAICVVPEEQADCHIVSDGTGGAIIAWHDDRIRENRDIYAQRTTSDGMIAWASNGIPICMEPSDQEYCSGVVQTSDGKFIIAWSEPKRLAVGGGGLDIYAQRVDLQGNISWKVNGVPVSTAPNHQAGYENLIADNKAGTIIVWKDGRSFDFTKEDIYAQRIRHDGSLGPPYISGDMNGDNLVNVLDVITVVNLILENRCGMILEPECLAADCNGPLGNCDGDGSVDILDVMKIVNLILRLDECS